MLLCRVVGEEEYDEMAGKIKSASNVSDWSDFANKYNENAVTRHNNKNTLLLHT